MEGNSIHVFFSSTHLNSWALIRIESLIASNESFKKTLVEMNDWSNEVQDKLKSLETLFASKNAGKASTFI